MSTQIAMGEKQHLAAIIDGHITTQLIASAVRFRVPDLLKDGPVSIQRLSQETGIAPRELARFLRALQGLGVVERAAPDGFRAGPLARHLQCDAGGLYGQALMAGGDYYDAWSHLDYSLRTGESAFEHHHGSSLWGRFAENAEAAAAFTRTMRTNTERALDEILGLYAFPARGLVADLGAGDGTLVAGLVSRFPELRAIIFEQPSVIEHTRRSLEQQKVGDRCEYIPGSLLDEVPRGADLYILKSVIHNWNEESALRILENCRTAMDGRGTLLLIERAMNEGNPKEAAIRDMVMLVLFGSTDRTVREYEELLERAGFTVAQTAISSSGLSLLEARPVT
ncbi:methyltransferase [Streptomyces violascens]|uniref:Methyltransferase n=1 Tax=Streptomyces violascens TaxID=67381 RepID=A0ABQ3QRL3_9ACTN|nr:methyltransferase [Streptomyces violascens]GGU48370.1 methyltransferase [Streptomyces violascens]GHI39912.1 methyltransferase [Streptomyces violascens]